MEPVLFDRDLGIGIIGALAGLQWPGAWATAGVTLLAIGLWRGPAGPLSGRPWRYLVHDYRTAGRRRGQ